MRKPSKSAARAGGAQPQPLVTGRGADVPAICGQSPVLTLGPRTHPAGHRPRLQTEFVLARPDVGAVAADHERKVAVDLQSAAVTSGPMPLLVGNPLQIAVVANRI